MTNSTPQTPPVLLLADHDLLAFTPVPLDRHRNNGWSAGQQERFILALHVMGSVGQAAKAVGLNRASARNRKECMLRFTGRFLLQYNYLSICCKFHPARTLTTMPVLPARSLSFSVARVVNFMSSLRASFSNIFAL
jgi:hypothetical protein